jgi:hypothetical protein
LGFVLWIAVEGGEDAAIVQGGEVTLMEESIDGGISEDFPGEICQECWRVDVLEITLGLV